MASKQFLDAIKKTRATKDLSELVVGSNAKYLPLGGPHDVYIKTVDATDSETTGFVKVTFANESDKEHTERVFLVAREGGIAYRLRLLLSAVFGTSTIFAEAADLFLDAVSQSDEAWGMLTGMKLRISIEQGQGFRIDRRSDGLYVPVDQQTGQVLPELDDGFESVADARTAAEARGYKKSYPRTKEMESLSDEAVQSNFNALRLAVEARQKAKAGNGRVGQTNVAGIKKTSSIL